MNKPSQLGQIFLYGMVWGMAGTLFGALFAGLYQVLLGLEFSSGQASVIAPAAAATITAAFYSAMPVALAGTAAGVFASIGYLMISGHKVSLPLITLIAGTAGLIAGAFYSWTTRSQTRPLAKTGAGLTSGLCAGIFAAFTFPSESTLLIFGAITAAVVFVVSLLFLPLSDWLERNCPEWLSPNVTAPMVAAVVAAAVGASVWIMGGTTAGMEPETASAVNQLISKVPTGIAGGFIGGAIAGIMVQLSGLADKIKMS
jgi:hypothetical protein